jgi:hypothetical protein
VQRAILIVLCLLIGLVGLAGGLLTVQPDRNGAIAAVFPPWWSASRSLAAAAEAGDVLRGGAFSFVLIVTSQRPGLDSRLRAAGAFMLIDPLDLAGCRPSLTTRERDV